MPSLSSRFSSPSGNHGYVEKQLRAILAPFVYCFRPTFRNTLLTENVEASLKIASAVCNKIHTKRHTKHIGNCRVKTKLTNLISTPAIVNNLVDATNSGCPLFFSDKYTTCNHLDYISFNFSMDYITIKLIIYGHLLDYFIGNST